MLFKLLLSLLVHIIHLVVSSTAISSKIQLNPLTDETRIIPNIFLIQVHPLQNVLDLASNLPSYLKIRYNFTTLFHGFSVQVDEDSIDDANYWMDQQGGVTAVWPSLLHTRSVVDSKPAPFIEDLEAAAIKANISIEFPALAQELGVTALQNDKIYGTGVKVGIIDTGVDYTNPLLGGCFGYNDPSSPCQVKYGTDLVGNAYGTGDAPPVPDDDPKDCDGHGTHVAGIIGSSIGIAENVIIGAYKVFGCTGGVSSDVLIAAMELTYADEMDVVNMSLGDGPSWPEYPTSQAANTLASLGVIVVAAAGNDGQMGLYSASAPSTGLNVISVASIDNTWSYSQFFSIGSLAFGYTSDVDSPPVVPTTLNGKNLSETLPANGCTPISNHINGTIAIIQRGVCTFALKALNAQAAGAVMVIVYDLTLPAGMELTPSLGGNTDINIPVVGVTSGAALKLLSLVPNHPVITWGSLPIITSISTGETRSYYSSIGFASDLMTLKPDISAPGGYIVSTYPVVKGSFASLSGTSMATPYITGCAALLVQKYKQVVSQPFLRSVVTTALMNNAIVRPGVPHPVLVGSGTVQVSNAFSSPLFVYPPKLTLTPNSKVNSQKLLICNIGYAAYYKARVVWSPILNASDPNVIQTLLTADATVGNTFHGMNVSFDYPSFSLGIDSVAAVNVTFQFTPPKDFDPVLSGWIYGGYVRICSYFGRLASDIKECVNVPFAVMQGLSQANPLLSTSVPDLPSVPFPNVYDPFAMNVISSSALSTFSMVSTNVTDDVPVIRFRLSLPSPEIIIYAKQDGNLIGTILDETLFGRSQLSGGAGVEWYELSWYGVVTQDTNSESSANLEKRSLSSSASGQTLEKMIASSTVILEKSYAPKNMENFVSISTKMAIAASTGPTSQEFIVPDGIYSIVIQAFHPLSTSENPLYEIWESAQFQISSLSE